MAICLRMAVDLLQRFVAVEMLAAGDEPDFELFEIDHGMRCWHLAIGFERGYVR